MGALKHQVLFVSIFLLLECSVSGLKNLPAVRKLQSPIAIKKKTTIANKSPVQLSELVEATTSIAVENSRAEKIGDDDLPVSPSLETAKNEEGALPSLVMLQFSSLLWVLSLAMVSLSPAPALIKAMGQEKATSTLSFLASGAAVGEIVLAPLLGAAIDAVGRKPALVGCMLSTVVVHTLTALRPGVLTICISRAVDGLAVGAFFVAVQAMMGDVVSSSFPAQLGTLMGRQFALVSAGFLFGALLAGRLAEYGLSTCYGVSSVFASLAAALVLIQLPETLSVSNRVPFQGKEARRRVLESPISCTHLLMRRGSKIRGLAILLMLQSAPQFMGAFLQVFATQRWGLEPRRFANIIALFGLSGIISNIAGSLLIQRLGLKMFTAIATISSLCFPLGASISHKGAILGIVFGVLGSAQSIGVTAALTLEGSKTGVPQGELAGERAALVAILKILGPIFYGSLYLHGNRLGLPHLPFLFNMTLTVLALILGQKYLS
eukprot:scaffold155559_cov47-Attheya_sp.AAC.2